MLLQTNTNLNLIRYHHTLKALIIARERYVKMLIKEEKKQLRSLLKGIEAIENEMKKIIESEQVLKDNYNKVTAVIGVGPVIATKCIVETVNFTKFSNLRKFSCYCGLAPFPYQSRSSVKGKTITHFLRDKSLKAILTKGAISAIQHDPQLKAYYKRKIKEGKHHMTVINAVANKLVLRIFAVTNRNEPFVKLAA